MPNHQDIIDRLTDHGIQPSAQRVAIAHHVLQTDDHPTADQVFQAVKLEFPLVSRATVYNTLNLFVSEGLLRQFTIDEGSGVFDPNTDHHHHFIDNRTGRIHDIPWDGLTVAGIERLTEFEIDEYMIVLRGRPKPPHG